MQANERHDIILQMLTNQEMVTIPELMNAFDVSIQTVRRDLNYLEQERLIKKVYGGAILFNQPVAGRSVQDRFKTSSSEKSAIGRKCAELINDGDSLYLGVGTTVSEVAQNLRNHKRLTILTASIHVVNALIDTDFNLYFIGGAMNLHDAYTSSYMPADAWDYFCPRKAIIGCSGISANFGVTDHNPNTAQAIKNICDRSMSVIVVADNNKFYRVGPCMLRPISQVSRIVTGFAKKEEILKDFPTYHQRFTFADGYTPDNLEFETDSSDRDELP